MASPSTDRKRAAEDDAPRAPFSAVPTDPAEATAQATKLMRRKILKATSAPSVYSRILRLLRNGHYEKSEYDQVQDAWTTERGGVHLKDPIYMLPVESGRLFVNENSLSLKWTTNKANIDAAMKALPQLKSAAEFVSKCLSEELSKEDAAKLEHHLDVLVAHFPALVFKDASTRASAISIARALVEHFDKVVPPLGKGKQVKDGFRGCRKLFKDAQDAAKGKSGDKAKEATTVHLAKSFGHDRGTRTDYVSKVVTPRNYTDKDGNEVNALEFDVAVKYGKNAEPAKKQTARMLDGGIPEQSLMVSQVENHPDGYGVNIWKAYAYQKTGGRVTFTATNPFYSMQNPRITQSGSELWNTALGEWTLENFSLWGISARDRIKLSGFANQCVIYSIVGARRDEDQIVDVDDDMAGVFD